MMTTLGTFHCIEFMSPTSWREVFVDEIPAGYALFAVCGGHTFYIKEVLGTPVSRKRHAARTVASSYKLHPDNVKYFIGNTITREGDR